VIEECYFVGSAPPTQPQVQDNASSQERFTTGDIKKLTKKIQAAQLRHGSKSQLNKTAFLINVK